MTHRISGVIPAAGRSTRMGRPKALLPFADKITPDATTGEKTIGEETAVARLVRVFQTAGIDPVRVVVHRDLRPAIAEALGISPGAASPLGSGARSVDPPGTQRPRGTQRPPGTQRGIVLVENNEEGAGLSDSIRTALRDHPLSDESAIALCPVDVPLVEPEDLLALIEAFVGDSPDSSIEARPAIVVPTRDGRKGHPALFRRDVAEELRDLLPDEPAHRVIRRDPSRVLSLPSANPELFQDLDTPEDYQAALDRHLLRVRDHRG